MTIRTLPSRLSSLDHANVDTSAPEGTPEAKQGPAERSLPSQRTVWEQEFLISRRSQTMAVSRREAAGALAPGSASRVRAVDRIDPLWEVDFESQFGGSDWQRVGVKRHRVTTDARGNVCVKTTDAFAPVTLPPKEMYTERAMRTMALLFQFGGLTTSQLCSFHNAPFQRLAGTLNRLYALGLVERMTPAWVHDHSQSVRAGHGSGDMWRVNLRSDQVTMWLEGLAPLEYALITGGRDANDLLHNGTFQYDHTLRHNLAVSELALRALEVMPGVAGVWGEPFVCGDRFLSEKVRNAVDVRYVRGDAAIVTKDGGVVIVEMTGVRDLRSGYEKQGKALAARAAAWATIAHLSDTPMSLVIVAIGGYTASRRISKHLRENTEQELSRYFASVSDKKAALGTVHMAAAESWWPSAGNVSRKFVTLEAFSPFTSEYRELVPADTGWDFTQPAVLNSVAAIHTPTWVLNDVTPLTEETKR